MESKQSLRIACPARRKSLAGKVRRSSERIADSNVALAVQGDAAHPAIKSIGSIGALLKQVRFAFPIQTELVPAKTAAPRRRIDRVKRDNRFAAADLPVNQTLHDFVALRIQLPGG